MSRGQRALARLARSVLAAWGLLGVELVVLAMVHHRQLASVWELQWATVWLLPTALALGLCWGALGSGLLSLAERGDARVPRLGASAAVGAATFVVAWGIGGGRHLSTLSSRGGFAVAVGLGSGLAAYCLLPRFARETRARPRAVALAALGTLLVLELVNRFVLVRLYPAFHGGLAAATVLGASLLPLAWTGYPPDRARSRRRLRGSLGSALVIGVGVLGLALARPSAGHLAHFDNFRLLAVNEAPLLGMVVRVAAVLSPPPPLTPLDALPCLEPGVDCRPDSARGNERTLDLSGRDVLLISIDAVRADHVGAYGYARPTTPNIDQLGREGAVFEQAYCATPHTSYSITSLMTGKYLRPLLLQGAGQDSDTWAAILRTYGYRTAGFFPPAVFFIDGHLFTGFKERHLDFEYRKFEFAEGDHRVAQVQEFLERENPQTRLFVWVHLFGPHEPYEAHAGHFFGERDVDKYDSEIAAADATVGKLVRLMRRRRPETAVIITSDHGEEFGDHGGRYHGTTVYEEQVRVPMIWNVPGEIAPIRISPPVQTIDLLPTVLASLDIPRPPRLRGRDLGRLMAGGGEDLETFALAETEEQVLLAEDSLRLICARKIGACELFDLSEDPLQKRDATRSYPDESRELRQKLRELGASHGVYEERGLQAEDRAWPAAILRGVSGDADAADDIAALLDDADRRIRRKAAEVLFDLVRANTAPALRLALARDEDQEVRWWCALALTRLGQGAPLAFELVGSPDLEWRRRAALALAESGDDRGEETLIGWWRDPKARTYSRSREILTAMSRIHSHAAVWPLVQSLEDVRLRPHIAATLASIGDDAARGPLAQALSQERYQSARVALADALVSLGGDTELIGPLTRYLGVPDPMPGGLGFALEAGILEHVGGPDKRALKRLSEQVRVGVAVRAIIPRTGNGKGIRVLVRASNPGKEEGEVHIGPRKDPLQYNSQGEPIRTRNVPRIDTASGVRIRIPRHAEPRDYHAPLPASMGFKVGHSVEVVVFAERDIKVDGFALVPLADELPPPPPEPWVRPEDPLPAEDSGSYRRPTAG